MNSIVVGTMTWGSWGANFTTDEMAQRIRECHALGLLSFDHADIYGGYSTEEAFGKGFAQSGVDREELIFISKCGIQYPCENRPLAVKHYDYSAKHIIASAEQSLRYLKTDYLDVLLLHRPSPLLDSTEVMEAFTQLKKSGKVNAFGVSNFTPSQLHMIHGQFPLEWNQIECSLSQSTALFDGTLDNHQTHQIGTMAWSPLGNFFREENEATKRVHALLDTLCEKYNATKDQLLLAWLLKHPAKIHPVVGTTKHERLALAKAAITISLTLEDWFLLHTAQTGEKVP